MAGPKCLATDDNRRTLGAGRPPAPGAATGPARWHPAAGRARNTGAPGRELIQSSKYSKLMEAIKGRLGPAWPSQSP